MSATPTARKAAAQKHRMCDMRAVLDPQTSRVAKKKPASVELAVRYLQSAGCKAATCIAYGNHAMGRNAMVVA